MIQFILSLFRPNVDRLLGQFTRTADKLRAVGAREADTAFDKADFARELESQARAHQVEAERAFEAARRIERLVNV